MSSIWGKNLKLSLFGESHSSAIGMVLDGFPAGICIDLDALRQFTDRRTAKDATLATARAEQDVTEFLCGILEGVSCGTPICGMIHNKDVRSADYEALRGLARPGHADYTGFLHYDGYNDARGGGHFSGRLTAPLVLAGGLCLQYLSGLGIQIAAHIHSIGTVHDTPLDPMGGEASIYTQLHCAHFPVIAPAKGAQMQELIRTARSHQDSVGGVVEAIATGLQAGVGDPFFDSVESVLSALLFSIPAVKGVEFGNGFACTTLTGSQNNDAFAIDAQGEVGTLTNRHGGILGGITSGMPLLVRAAIKPTPTIAQVQNTVDFVSSCNTTIVGKGRHDPCIVPRAVVCVESAVALALTDVLLGRR